MGHIRGTYLTVTAKTKLRFGETQHVFFFPGMGVMTVHTILSHGRMDVSFLQLLNLFSMAAETDPIRRIDQLLLIR